MNRIASIRRAFTFAACLLLPTLAIAVSNVWINEIHYDNTGGDTNEFVEIAGNTGANLSGFSLLLYNGHNNSKYETVGLSGTLLDDTNSFGFLTFATPGIQNGSNDGIALYNGSTILQFLSYEGTLTANNGEAVGLLSDDIVVSETSSTPVGASLQLTGFGSSYRDFTWQAFDTNTSGSVNTGQSFPKLDTNSTSSSAPDNGTTFALCLLGFAALVIASPTRTTRRFPS